MAAYLAGRDDGGDLWVRTKPKNTVTKADFDLLMHGGAQGRPSNSIWLPNDDPFLVDKMIQYFYTGDYDSDTDTGLFIVVKPGPRGTPEAPELTMEGVADLATRDNVEAAADKLPGRHAFDLSRGLGAERPRSRARRLRARDAGNRRRGSRLRRNEHGVSVLF